MDKTLNKTNAEQGLSKDLSGDESEGTLVPSEAFEAMSVTAQDDASERGIGETGESLPKKKRLSGAAKKRLRRERAAQSGEPLHTPETQTHGKRSRRNEETPDSQKKEVKRPRGSGPHGPMNRAYADAASGLPRVAILHSDRGREITAGEGCLIEDGLVELLDGLGEGDFIPRFQDTHVYRGTLRVTCADTQSEGWLRQNVPRIVKWEGARLDVLGVNELPKIVKVIAHFPGREKDPKVLLARLERQNPGLTTGKWQVYDAPKEHEDAPVKSVRLVLGVEESCLPVLEKLEMRPYCGMRRANFQFARHGTQGRGGNPTQGQSLTA